MSNFEQIKAEIKKLQTQTALNQNALEDLQADLDEIKVMLQHGTN